MSDPTSRVPRCISSPTQRVQALFLHFNPLRGGTSGFQAWFRRELADNDILVTPKTVSLWFKNGVPPDRASVVESVLRDLEDVMVVQLKARIEKVRR